MYVSVCVCDFPVKISQEEVGELWENAEGEKLTRKVSEGNNIDREKDRSYDWILAR